MGKIKEAVKLIGRYYLLNAIGKLRVWCKNHPTCDGCQFREKYKGCMFRGKTPREW